MKYALISDVHANLPALEAVLTDIAARSDVDAVYHLGDLVGYSSSPNEVVARLHAQGIMGVSGNYDSTVATHYKHCGCRAESPRQEELAHTSFEWTLANTSPDVTRLLAALPFRLDIRPLGGHVAGPTVALVHAHPSNSLIYVTEDRPDDFLMKMAEAARLRPGDVLAFGHTHKPWHREVQGPAGEPGVHFINTGSVGRPKDGDWRAGYVLLDVGDGAGQVEFVRVEYDIERAVAGVRAAGLPDEFAEFLRTGGKPVAAKVGPDTPMVIPGRARA
jgi:predicted phosphodiesterase